MDKNSEELTHPDESRRRAEEHRELEWEAQKREFYQKTLLAATDGRLVILERSDIRLLAGDDPLGEWSVDSAAELAGIRDQALALATSHGMDNHGTVRLATCIGEATSNALKHASSGTASLHKLDGGLLFEVEDHGPGIDALNIPRLALSYGYSTAGTLGMGYKLMILSARRVYLATGPDGTTVACEVRFHNDAASEQPGWCIDEGDVS